tara:strand:+ start:2471 stop:2992 length:522 start_codon:yes stop_codon:yes gene_type:complete
MGAGILPISIHKGVIFFLMGQERSDNLWSDFGGSSNKGEAVLQTAIREGTEELNGLMGSNLVLQSKVTNNLIKFFYWNRYTTYLFKVDKDDNLPTYFDYSNQFAEIYLKDMILDDKKGLYEKTRIKWFTIGELEQQKMYFRPFYRNIITLLNDDYDLLLEYMNNDIFHKHVNN